MKKDDNKILKASLSTLLHRFSGTDIVSGLEQQYQIAPTQVSLNAIRDNGVISKARISEEQLKAVMKTVSEKGISSPLFIFRTKDAYEILYPRIVYIAAKKLKLDYVPCALIVIPEDEMLVFLAYTLMNSKRSNIIELSLVLNRLQKKFHYKQVEIAMMMEQSRSQITNIMRLIKLPDYVCNDISNNKLSFGHARALVKVKEEEIPELLELIYRDNLSVRQLEKLLYERSHNITLGNKENKISKKYGCDATISHNRISLTFDKEEDLEKFIKHIS